MSTSLCVCMYWMCVWVCMGISVRNSAVRSHMFVQSGQDGSECCWIWYSLMKVWIYR